MTLIETIKNWLIHYDPKEEGIPPPTGEVKKKKKSKSKGNKGGLYVDSEGNAFKENKGTGADLEWSQTDEKKSGVTIPGMTNAEAEGIQENELNKEKYEELRRSFFLGYTPYTLAKKYKNAGTPGYAKSTIYPYYNVWREIHRPIRPKK